MAHHVLDYLTLVVYIEKQLMKLLCMTLIFILVCQFYGCKDGAGLQGEKPDIPVIRNGIDRVYKRLVYQIVRSFGSEDQIQVLGAPRSIKADMIGNIYLLDSQKESVLKFDPDLEYIISIGTKGEGPGEFNYARCMAIDGSNRLYVADLARKINIFNDKGEHVQTIKTDFMIHDMFIDKRSNRLTVGRERVIYNDNGKHMFDKEKHYCLGDFSLEGMKLTEFYTKEQFVFKKIQNRDVVLILPLFVLFTGYADDIYVCSGDRYEITIYGKERQMKQKIIKEHKPIPVGKKALKIGKEMLKQYPNLVNRFAKIAGHQPVMKSIAIDEEGRIWIELYQPYETWKDSYQTQYDLFAKNGEYLFTVEIMEKMITPLLFKNNHIYCVTESEAGDRFIKKLKIITIE